MKSSTTTLIAAMRILAADIQSSDGVANLAIAEAADRLEELDRQNRTMRDGLEAIVKHQKLIAGPAAEHSLIAIIAKKALNHEQH